MDAYTKALLNNDLLCSWAKTCKGVGTDECTSCPKMHEAEGLAEIQMEMDMEESADAWDRHMNTDYHC